MRTVELHTQATRNAHRRPQVGLSGTFGMTVPITGILDSGELLIDCDDQEGLEMLFAFDVANEDLDLG